MWLINTKTLALEPVVDAKQHRFAILSHTWEDGEVTFQDMQDLAVARQKPGFAKIEMTCRIARSANELKYAWIDTCCIDKTSSAELSEAINSMFAWYGDAEVCFVYFADLEPMPTQVRSEKDRLQSLAITLARCKWFTRGWTLQELIAPRRIEFFDRTWSFIGAKEELHGILSDITGIDRSVMFNTSSLRHVPVARRMSWAAKRKTTRLEDEAYCLLGIFDINMPLLYGEGSKAFLRLQEAIVSDTNDLSLFAWRRGSGGSGLQQYSGIFAHSPADFLNSSTMRRHGNQFHIHHEFATTNNGLRIEANLQSLPKGHPYPGGISSEYLLDLDCVGESSEPDSQVGWLSIQLTKLGNTLIRVHPDKIFTTASQGRAQSEADKEPVYIRKTFEVEENIRMQSFQNTRIVVEFQDALTGDVDWVAAHPARSFSVTGQGSWLLTIDSGEGFLGTLTFDLDRNRRKEPCRYIIACGLQWKDGACQPWYALLDEEKASLYGLEAIFSARGHRNIASTVNGRPVISEGSDDCLSMIRDAMLIHHSDVTGSFTQNDIPTSIRWGSRPSGGLRLLYQRQEGPDADIRDAENSK